MINPYAQRRFLRTVEKIWVRLDGLVNRFAKSDFNPFYHLGTITIFLLIVLLATGVYLTVIYRPGADVAYQTVEAISSNWFGRLMRSAHKYASDAMIVVIGLHFLKMLFSDRYWGARWLAWTSGWIMLAGVWITGTMGYWLIWDQRAQWMTEFMMMLSGGSEGLTYVAPDLASKTFSNFVIILFLHVFIPLIAFLGIYIHSLRLARARWWAPRWVMIQTVVGLVVLSLIKPVTSAVPADLSRIIASTPMDALYLGFLPLAEQWGNLIFFGLAFFVFGGLFLLPWLARGRDLGPVTVINENCTGCVLCATECPYDAIRMVARDDDSGYQKLAVINAAQCTACGICLGACPTDAIAMRDLTAGKVLASVRAALAQAKQDERPATVLFLGQREHALDSLPRALRAAARTAAVSTAEWQDAGRVITVALPSASAVNIEWVKLLQSEGARDVVIFSSPYDDSLNREDAHWILNRLHLRPALVVPGLHWLEAAPGEAQPLVRLLDDLHREDVQAKKTAPSLPPVKQRTTLKPPVISAVLGALALTLIFAVSLFVDIPAGMSDAGQGALRIALDAKGKISAAAIPANVTLPPGADPVKIFGGRHYPVHLRVVVDGAVVLEDTYEPTGLSGNGRIAALEYLNVPPGMHTVAVFIKDDDHDLRPIFNAEINFPAGTVILLTYNEGTDSISVR